MMNEDVISVEITEDGLIRSTTPKISAANHSGAAEFYKLLTRFCGGAYSAVRRTKEAHTHSHEHEQDKLKGGN
jgi:hypothetical protein